jgi:hypothetical protein
MRQASFFLFLEKTSAMRYAAGEFFSFLEKFFHVYAIHVEEFPQRYAAGEFFSFLEKIENKQEK